MSLHRVKYLPKREIGQGVAFLDTKWDEVLSVPTTHQLRCIKPNASDKLKVTATSDGTDLMPVTSSRLPIPQMGPT